MLAAADNSKPDFLTPAIKSLVHAVAATWYVWLLILLVAAGKLAYRSYAARRLAKSGIADVDRMDGATFEAFLMTVFRRLGYRVEHTGRRGDYGSDLVVAKDGRRVAVQAKRWTKNVGVKAVQEAVASKGIYNCSAALVVANRPFTRAAQTLARANDVELWDRDVLVGKLLTVREDGVAPATTESTPAPTQAPLPSASADVVDVASADGRHCVVCGAGVSDKVRAYCLDRPQRFAGRIYCFDHQRGVRSAALR